tara:strand:- start:1023 stop:1676 length:654 start_codon:yes stop_codon:yes gene_type:complete
MKRTTLFALGLIASTVTAGAAIAQGTPQHGVRAGQAATAPHQGGMGGAGQAGGMGGGMGGAGQAGGMGNMGGMMQMMQKMHGQMMSGGMGGGMMGGGMGGAANMAFDTDGDGKVSPDEMRAGLAAQLAQYDADSDGVLSIAEFEALNSAMIRNQMVDRFQALDEDGDGQVTGDEMAATAARLEKMMANRAQSAGGNAGEMPTAEGMGDDDMMNNDNN